MKSLSRLYCLSTFNKHLLIDTFLGHNIMHRLTSFVKDFFQFAAALETVLDGAGLTELHLLPQTLILLKIFNQIAHSL